MHFLHGLQGPVCIIIICHVYILAWFRGLYIYKPAMRKFKNTASTLGGKHIIFVSLPDVHKHGDLTHTKCAINNAVKIRTQLKVCHVQMGKLDGSTRKAARGQGPLR